MAPGYWLSRNHSAAMLHAESVVISTTKRPRKLTSEADVIVIDSDLEDDGLSTQGPRSVSAVVVDCSLSDDEDVLCFDASECVEEFASPSKKTTARAAKKRNRTISSDSEDPEFCPDFS
jgi:hypothetical protein